MGNYYGEHTGGLRRALGTAVPSEALREIHRRRPAAHFSVAAALVAVLALSATGAAVAGPWYLWIPLSVVAGFAIFNFTVLLHEVVHGVVTNRPHPRLQRILGFAYAVPSGISPTQFTRWHLDHHAGLGSDVEDPKRHHLSPKLNARWLKLLYFTPALFFIYFRAARREAAGYEPELRRRIAVERNVAMAFHVLLLVLLVATGGWPVALKAYVVPYFFVFPVAFALNRLGQHYDIDPADPAAWSTLVRGSRLWDVVYLGSNYHLEHHYFPKVPLYNLPRLQRLLLPFYEERGMRGRTYGSLFRDYIIRNRAPHTDWREERVGAEAARRAV
jgi:fatty acid desaturase